MAGFPSIVFFLLSFQHPFLVHALHRNVGDRAVLCSVPWMMEVVCFLLLNLDDAWEL